MKLKLDVGLIPQSKFCRKRSKIKRSHFNTRIVILTQMRYYIIFTIVTATVNNC